MLMEKEYNLIGTEEYKRLLKKEKLLESIQEGKDYNWLQKEYRRINEYIAGMQTITIDTEKGETK